MSEQTKVRDDLLKFILNCVPSEDTENDWGIEAAAGAGVHEPDATIPPSKDLREEAWWKIGNQGRTGSCVGWGTAEGVLRWHFVKAGRLQQDEPLSVRYLWMAAKESNRKKTRPTTFIEIDGTPVKGAMDVVQNFGIVTNSVLPFENPPNTPELYIEGDENKFYALAAQRRISGYFNLGRDLASWRRWIANNGPIVTRLDVDSTWYNAGATQGKLEVYYPPSKPAGHCVALVGYAPDYFIVRNSWGTDWGDKGFAYASEKYAAAAFTEAYGVTL